MKSMLLSIVTAVAIVVLPNTTHAQQKPQEAAETVAEKLARMHPGARPKEVVTSFHRRAVDSNEAPWKSVGRVNIAGLAHCTGSLIAENLVLTAAHCLYIKKMDQMAPASVVHFLAGYAKGEYLAHSRVTQYTVGRGFDAKLSAIPENMPHDWALLVLEKPLGAEHGFLEIHENLQPNSDGIRRRVALPTSEIVTAGYPGDRSHLLSLEENCSVQTVRARGRVLVTDCTAIKGDSGGPILQKSGENWSLIGLNVASLRSEQLQGSIVLSALAFRDTFAAVRRQLAEEAETAANTPGE